MKTAYLYIRVSTDEQADKGYSQRNQEEVLRRYCETHSIQVRKVIYEDHSAKTFNRPEWAKLLSALKKHRGQTDLVLFTKWDRFSRNAPDAYAMIEVLRRLGLEPQAVEQPLDLSIPENKIILAIYLTAPEVENDRRALNVFFGMRRAKKEGRWMGTAPIGYVNKISETGRKSIALKEPQACIVRWVFEVLAEGQFNTEQVWKLARKKGLTCSKNNFWLAIRNPLYCGKIFIPKYKDEDAHFVAGQHQPLISEALFYKVQDILNGRKRSIGTKIVSVENLPLRGFLSCPKCDKKLTGSASKGRNNYYYYYHCTSSCGFRVKAEVPNRLFRDELKKYVPHPAIAELYKQVVLDVNRNQEIHLNKERQQYTAEIEEQNKRISKARNLLLDGDLEADDYKLIKTEAEEKIESLEMKISSYATQIRNLENLLNKATSALSNMDVLYENGSINAKREIIGSIFPEGLIFDGTQYRTANTNEAARLIYLIERDLEGIKNGTSDNFLHLSRSVHP